MRITRVLMSLGAAAALATVPAAAHATTATATSGGVVWPHLYAWHVRYDNVPGQMVCLEASSNHNGRASFELETVLGTKLSDPYSAAHTSGLWRVHHHKVARDRVCNAHPKP